MDLLAARSRPARTPARHNRIAGAGWWIHLIGAIALVAGLFLPLTTLGSALAAPGGDPAALTRLQEGGDTVPSAPAQVAAVGDFQTQLGCAEFDPYCQTTQLTEHQGIWTGVFAVPPGQYSWQIQAVAPDGSVYTYGQGGLDGAPQQVAVSDGDAGLYFRLNTHTNEVEAAPVSELYSVSIDGTSVALNPAGGQLTALVTSQAGGPATAQVFAGGDPLGEPQPVQLEPGPNRLTFSPDGQLVNVEPLTGATLTVERLDAAGNPLPGGCYQLLSGGTLVNQACDADTGADGYTTMNFPEGVPGGTATLVEVTPPDGAEPVPDQEIELAPGELFISLQPEAAAEPTEAPAEPTEVPAEPTTEDGQVIEGQATEVVTEEAQGEPGDLLVYLSDSTGAPIPGACFQLLQGETVVAERCDREPDDSAEFANNGTTGFFGVPSGTYTLRLSEAPSGATAEDVEVEVLAGQTVEESVTAQLAATETAVPTEVPPTATVAPTETPVPEPANFTVTLVDQNGAPVGGACFQLVRDGQVAAESCDTEAVESAEFANNGNTGFFDIAPGTYTLRMSAAPEGVAPVEDRQVDIAPGSEATETISVEVAVPTAPPTETPEPTVVPTQPPAEGDIVVLRQDAQGNMIGGACFEVVDQNGNVIAPAVCDEDGDVPDDGRIGIFGVPEGTWTLRETRTPEGYEPAPEIPVEVGSGGVTEVVVSSSAVATEAPTEAPSPTEAPEEGPGDLTVTLVDETGAPIGGACWQLLDGETVVAESCDTSDWESAEFANNGNTGFFDVPAGTYTLRMTSGPEGVSAEDQEVQVTAGTEEIVTVTGLVSAPTAEPTQEPTVAPTEAPPPTETAVPTETPAPEPANFTVTLEGPDGAPIGGACWELVDADGDIVGPSCDTPDQESAEFANNGNTGFFDIAPGTYTLRLVSAPEGVSAPEQQVEIAPGSDDVRVVTAEVPEVPEEATEAPPAEPTATAAATEAPTEETAVEPGPPANLIVELHDADGEPIGGACFQIAMEGQPPIVSCDADDPFPGNGRTGFFGVPSGTYTLSQTTVPSGTNPIDEREITIQPGENPDLVVTPGEGAGVTAAQQEEPDVSGQEPGTVTIDVSALGGGEICVQLDTASGIGFANPPVACDGAEGDQNPEPGLIGFSGIEPGTYQLSVISGAEGVQPQEIEVLADAPTQVTLGEEEPEPTATVAPTQTPEPTTGTITITVVDSGGNAVGGACFDITNPSGGPYTFCDEDGDGTIEVPDAVFGMQTIAPNTIPAGYADPEPQQVELSLDQQSAEVQFQLEVATGAVEVTSLNEQGEPLPGACVALDGGEPVCEEDATVTFEEVPVGEHTVTQTDVPEGFQPAGEQGVTVAEGQTAEVEFQTTRQTGTIEALIRDTAGNALPGACVALDGGDPVCDTAGTGSIVFEGVPVGQHTVEQTQAPEGYTGITSPQTVGVGAEQPVTVTFENEVATGSIVATVLDASGAAVPGVCVVVDSDATEPQTLCEAAEGGVYRFDELQPGVYSVSLSQVPEEYIAPEAEQVEVTAGGEATVAFELAEAPPQTGNAQLSLLTEDGQAAVGVCVALTNVETGEQLGPFCDGGEGDGDATEGVLLIEDIPVGSYEVTFPNQAATARLEVAGQMLPSLLQDGEPIIIEILAGQTIQVEITVPGLFVLGAIEIRTVDAASGAAVPGACYTISTAEPTEVCDGGEGDESTDDGTVLVSGLAAGDYTVTMTSPPEGYTGGGEQTVTVTGGQTASLSFEVEAEVTTGSLTVLKVNDAGESLPGACFRLQTGEGAVARACDESDGESDGTIVLSDVPAGTYELVETRTPRGYQTVAARSVEITAGGETEIEVVNTPAPGRLNVIKVDAADPSVRLEGACFELRGAMTYGPFCDGDDLAEDGRIVFTGVAPGTYTLVETQAPGGYDPASNREVTIRAGVTLQVTVQNQETPPPPEAGTLVVNKLGPDNEALAGGCFRLFDGDTPVTGEVCDITDGTNDARIVFENVPAGTWTLRETLAPSPAYQLAADQEVTIEDGETTEADVVNPFKNGRILVKKETPKGHPIAGACFELQPDQGEPLCSDANGEILFENLPVGTYTLVETTVPYGFREAEPVENIQVRPAQTTIVTVENERQPPPNTGSVQVLKFVCPVDSADEERTSFLGGAAGNAELAQTKGCAPADAEFTLVGQDGTGGPGAFSTGRDGQYQVTVPAEVYRLDETSPDLPGNSAALLRVEVGRLTTVVVINYVAPPAPEPVDIHVTKYTCQAGFNGTTFADFAASCMNNAQLTNNITVRAEGPADLKAVTGDGGQAGRTVFADQPSGTWTIYEERPYNIPTNYQFCGWDPNAPADFKAVNGAVTAELGEGDQFHCVLFNIPEPVTDSTGVILVRKYVCDVETPPKGYDFEQECRLSDQLATFELKRFNEEMQDYGDGVQQTANPDGILRFVDLRPGSFQLREVGANWCYANSNSVNAKGDVVVRAGQVSLVSIYNCVGTSEPPNTGSGDAADLLNPNPEPATPAPGGLHVTPGVAWPLAAIAAVLFALRPRRVLAPGRDWRLDAEPDRDAA